MKTVIYNNQTIIAYLLGLLPEAEAEAFDELSFTDDEFADELKVVEKDLVDAYVNGELKGEKLEKFKTYYLASPVRREKVEFAQAFQVFAEKNIADTETIPATVEAKTKQTLAGFLSNIFTFSRPSWQWGFAFATLALMLFGGWLFLENSRLRSQMNEDQAKHDAILQRESELLQREKQLQDEIANQRTTNAETEKELANIRAEREKLERELKNLPEPKRIIVQPRQTEERAEINKTPTPPNRQISIASFILSPSLRGNNQLPSLSLPPKVDLVAMQLQLESDDYKSYRVALQNQTNGQILWQSGKIRSKTNGANKVLNLSFPAKLLKSQVYSLQVSGISADGATEIISDYSLVVP